MASRFQYLFTPLQIGPVEVLNRIVQTAHGKGFEDHVENYGLPSEKTAYYLIERAKGGAGLLILGEQMVHPTSGDPGGLRDTPHAYKDEIVPRYKMIADGVHAYGTKVFSQLGHIGCQGYGDRQEDLQQVWAPSAIPGLGPQGVPKEMEIEDIEEVIQGFARSAQNSKRGGLDGVEIHAGHGYLPHQFLSPVSNRRHDQYGGDLSNRMRFLLEVVDVVREAVGKDLAVGVRISADEFLPRGLTLDDMKEVARTLQKTGKVDYIDVSAGTQFTTRASTLIVLSYLYPPGMLVPYAAAIKAYVEKIPVLCVGSITSPELAEKILAEGQADLVGMCRALIADPELPKKAREGRLDDIRGCIRCLQGCVLRAASSLPLGCVQNPAVGREKRFGIGTLKPTGSVKRVMVIGGGPAGLKAAEIAARRGHKVALFEKESNLGGQVALASVTPLRREFAEVTRYLETQIKKLRVEIKTSLEVDEGYVEAEQPDAIVVATGCVPVKGKVFLRDRLDWEEVPGAKQGNVITVWDVLHSKDRIGRRVMVMDGDAHPRNIAVADYLASDHNVEIVTTSPLDVLPRRIHPYEAYALRERIRDKGLKIRLSTRVKEISGDKVVLLHIPSGKEEVIQVDTIVWATGTSANDSLYFRLKGKTKELYRIGDCVSPRWVDFAIWEGEMVGRSL